MSKIKEATEIAEELYGYAILNKNDFVKEKSRQLMRYLDLISELETSLDKNEDYSDEIAKVKRKVPKWMKKTHQYNYLILKAFMDISDNNEHRVSVEELEEYVNIGQAFLANYNNLKTISEKNHAKVFEEVDRMVGLWEPVAEFIVKEFENGEKMTKKKAASIINQFYKDDRLDPSNNGNVKFANRGSSKDVYWINIHMDSRIEEEYHLILNDDKSRKFIHLVIPPNTFKLGRFIHRFDKTNGLEKFDIELSIVDLIDIKSGGTNFCFKDFEERIYSY